MEAIVSVLIPAIVENVFGALTEAVGLSDWLRQRLDRDPEKLAFRQALTQALTDSASHYPGRDLRYLAEILRDIGGPLLARTLQPAAPLPTADELTNVWLNHLTVDSLIHYRTEFTQFATYFLDRLQFHLENQQPLQWIVQARRQRSSEEAIRRMADVAEQSATNIEALGQEVARLMATLATMLQTSSSSTVTTGGGAYNAGTISAQNFAGRDLTINQYFVQGLARVATANYSERIENFLSTYLGRNDNRVPFGGRQQQVDELNHWLDEPDMPPYYLMVAEAGRGKSALVSRWSAQLATRPELDVIFVPISIRFQTAAQDVFFAALAARLAQIHEPATTESFYRPTSAEEWKAICESYLRRPLPEGKRLVVILDGLDEAMDWVAGPELFAVRPPLGLHILVTARLRTRETDALGWAATLQWEGSQLARKVTLPALDQLGVEDALNSMGNPLHWLAPRLDVARKLYELSQGDPLLVQLYVRELVKAQQHAGFLATTDLETIEPGLDRFMQKWWDDQRNQWRMQKKDPNLEEKQVLPLLSACAVAVGPLLLSDLATLDGMHFGVTRLVANQAELLGRWLIGDGVHQGYVFAHPRLREFFAGATWLSADEYGAWQAKFCDWGRRVLNDLNRGNLLPRQAPEYLLRHYATHLTQSNAAPRRFYALISDGWRRAWEAVDVSYGGFLKDVDRVWAQARQAYGPQRPRRGEALAQQIRAALCRSSVATLGSNLPPALLAELVKRGLRTSTEALAMIKLMPKAEQRAPALTAVAPHLATDVLDEALAVARASKCEYENLQINALCALAIRFPEAQKTAVLREALAVTDAIIVTKGDIALAYHTLAPHLPPPLLAETLAKLREVGYENYFADIFIAFAKHLSTDELKRTLEDSFDDRYASRYASWIENSGIPMFHLLTAALPVELLEEAVDAACKERHPLVRGLALNALLPYLPVHKREQIVAKEVEFPYYQIEGLRLRRLAALAPWLSEEQRTLIIEPIANSTLRFNDWFEANAMIALVPYLPPATHRAALAIACSSSRTVRLLQALAPSLSEELVKEAFDNIREDSLPDRINVLSPYLPTELLELAWQSRRTIMDDDDRIDVLTKLVAHLSVNLRAMAVAAITTVKPERLYSLDLIPYLPAAQFRTTVNAAILKDWVFQKLDRKVLNLADDELRIVLREINTRVESLGPFANELVISDLVVQSYWPANEKSTLIKQITLHDHEKYHYIHQADWLIRAAIPDLTGRERLNAIKVAFAAIYGYSDLAPSHAGPSIQRLSGLSLYLPPQSINEVLAFIDRLEDEKAQTVALGVLAIHFPNPKKNALLKKALTLLCQDYDCLREFGLEDLVPHLTLWATQQPQPGHAAFAENLVVLAEKQREEFMRDLTALMPFILALAGDEAPQAAEGIYHAIQEVCGWWP